MNSLDIEKSKALIIVETIEYVANSIISKPIIKRSTGTVSVVAIETGEGLTEKISQFDTFAQIIEGRAEIVINGNSNILETGQSIIVPAYTSHMVKATERFKMILTIIKGGDDQVL